MDGTIRDRWSLTPWLDWLDQRKPLEFIAILYLVRWALIFPASALGSLLFSDAALKAASVPREELLARFGALGLLVAFTVLSPLAETLIMCTVPYTIFAWVFKYGRNRPERAWTFVLVSALMMVGFSPIPGSILFSFITGAFVAYSYAHFAPLGARKAILAAAGFLAAINVVGWTFIVLS